MSEESRGQLVLEELGNTVARLAMSVEHAFKRKLNGDAGGDLLSVRRWCALSVRVAFGCQRLPTHDAGYYPRDDDDDAMRVYN